MLPDFRIPEGIIFPRNRDNWIKSQEEFPMDTSRYVPVYLDLDEEIPPQNVLDQLKENVQFGRDAIVFGTALAGVKGLGAHTGGNYDIWLEHEILASIKRSSEEIYPLILDSAGHRVFTHDLRAALEGHISFGDLLHYREAGMGLPGHPDPEMTPGIGFAGGRLGHMHNEVNGICLAHPNLAVLMHDSDGSQQEDRVAGAARFAVQHNLKAKWIIDDNDATIAGKPRSDYLDTFNLERFLRGLGMEAEVMENPDNDILGTYTLLRNAILHDGPSAVVLRREMMHDFPPLKGKPKAHDVISYEHAMEYLEERGLNEAMRVLTEARKDKNVHTFTGCDSKMFKCRSHFGKVVSDILDERPDEQPKTLAIDADLGGSCGLEPIKERHPGRYIQGPINESGNLATAAAFGHDGRQGITGTFGAFSEMDISEITMARMQGRRLLVSYSHTGVDDMADDYCHFGINMFLVDNGVLEGDDTRMYAFADVDQMDAGIRAIWDDPGLRFVLSTRAGTPKVTTEEGKPFYKRKKFVKDKDDVIREGTAGYVVTYGENLWRSLKAVDELRQQGVDIGLINKTTLNTFDEETMTKLADAPLVLVVESQNYKNGLGRMIGDELHIRGARHKYDHLGITKKGVGGLGYAQMEHQGLDPENIKWKLQDMHYSNVE